MHQLAAEGEQLDRKLRERLVSPSRRRDAAARGFQIGRHVRQPRAERLTLPEVLDELVVVQDAVLDGRDTQQDAIFRIHRLGLELHMHREGVCKLGVQVGVLALSDAIMQRALQAGLGGTEVHHAQVA
eukprot:scaffold79_cov259-Pinguiococcus_pyrenoidosus.AAC.43